MEKFALLDFLKAFQTLTANNQAEKEVAAPAPQQPQQPPAPPSPPPTPSERNPMADVIARHEEIANRIRNKK